LGRRAVISISKKYLSRSYRSLSKCFT
jgi:hypothetical protein